MIIVHDLGQHLGCYGAGIRTPNIDALAADGVLFDNHFCTAAQCSPSRGGIMTGRMPHNNGLIGLAHLGWQIGAQEVTLPMYLNAAGYSTHLLGHQHEHPEPARLGYQDIQPAVDARAGAAFVSKFLQERTADPSDQPFFINSGWGEPHRPHIREGYDNDDPAQVQPLYWLPDRPGIREDLAGMNGLIYRVDECVGQVRRALAESGLADNTLLIFTTDHGTAMPRAKGTCYDPGLKTAFLAHWPGHFEGGKRYPEMISNMDLLPTLLDLAGQRTPDEVEGRSFLPLLEGPSEGPRFSRPAYVPHDRLFSEMTWHDKYNPMRAVRTRTHKFIRNFGDRPLVYLPLDVWNGPAGEAMREDCYGTRRPMEELYDLERDPLERSNVIDDPAYRDVAARLRAQVEQYMLDSNDPLLYGDIPPSAEQAERIKQWLADN
jgi:arylsulfatase A-like enzyme